MDTKETQQYLILKCYGGSIAYGTNTPESDVDVRGIFIPPKDYWLGLKRVDQCIGKDPDTDYKALARYLELALGNNPNILEYLFLLDKHYIWRDVPDDLKHLGKKLIENRDLFLSKKCKHSYLGYAWSQFTRMDKLNANVNQNKRRLDLVEKFGYDTKNAMHLIRLLRTGMEILVEQTIHVHRDDARELLDIKAGKYTYEQLKEQVDRYKEMIEEAYVKSTLQYSPDREKVHQLCMEMAEEAIAIYNKRT